MSISKKYIAEFIGTLVLVTFGCGTAMLVGCDWRAGGGYILTALAFGLAIVAMAYSIGNISGCHVNPAVSLAVWMKGGMTSEDLIGYIVAQCLGSLAGSGILAVIFILGDIPDQTGAFGSNGLGNINGSSLAGLVVEIVLTFVFVLTILGVTSKKAGHGSFGGLVIGLTLTFVHILGIGLTGTSVNPARSIGPAIASAINGNAEPLSCLWVFIAGPVIGAMLSAFVYRFLEIPDSAKPVKEQAKTKSEPKPAPKIKPLVKNEKKAEETTTVAEEVNDKTEEKPDVKTAQTVTGQPVEPPKPESIDEEDDEEE